MKLTSNATSHNVQLLLYQIWPVLVYFHTS